MGKLGKILAVAMAGCMVASAFAGCTDNNNSSSAASDGNSAAASDVSTDGVEKIYFLNFKPEISEKYDAIAAEYEKETGIKVKVVTAASNEYEKTLTSEIAKSDPPTIFQINGPVGYQNWKDYTADLKDSELYNILTDENKGLAVADGDGIYGIPYALEGYGIIYNNEIMDKYFASSKKTSSVASVDEINNFEKLKEVVEDMTAMKDELGIDGVFASTSMSAGNDWRWQTHLANLPLYYEFKDADPDGNIISNGSNADEITFKYNKNYQNIFDLYTNNSTTDKGLLSGKSVDDSMAEFALGKAAMVQNGNWGWGQISGVEGNVTKAENIKFMPIYTGVEGEEKQGLCIGTENYFAINSQVDEAKQKASIDFLVWLFSSDYGKNAVTNELGFITPFNTFTDADQPTDPLAQEVLSWKAKESGDIVNPEWLFTVFPSEQFKADFGAALLEYVQDQKTWDEVTTTVIDSWAAEKAATAE